jgi:hypothetical protein
VYDTHHPAGLLIGHPADVVHAAVRTDAGIAAGRLERQGPDDSSMLAPRRAMTKSPVEQDRAP